MIQVANVPGRRCVFNGRGQVLHLQQPLPQGQPHDGQGDERRLPAAQRVRRTLADVGSNVTDDVSDPERADTSNGNGDINAFVGDFINPIQPVCRRRRLRRLRGSLTMLLHPTRISI